MKARLHMRGKIEDIEVFLVGEVDKVLVVQISKAPLESLPLPFVVKASNSSGSNVFVRTREELNCFALERDFPDISSWHVGMATDEWHYFEIPARILIEPMLQGPDDAIPLDYKFHMFHGRLEEIQVDIGRFVNHRRALYTPEWTKMDVALHYPLAEETFLDQNCFPE